MVINTFDEEVIGRLKKILTLPRDEENKVANLNWDLDFCYAASGIVASVFGEGVLLFEIKTFFC